MTELAHPSPDMAPLGAPYLRRTSTSDRVRALVRRVAGRDLYGAALSVYRLARGPEVRAPYPLRDKLWAWAHGFRADSAALYDLRRNDPRDYLNDYTRLFRCININPLRALFDEKLLLRAFLLQRGFAQAETVALISNGCVQIRPFDESGHYVDLAALERWLIEDGGRFIVKPSDGYYGNGVYLLEVRDGALVRRRGTELQPFHFVGLGRVTTLVERVVEQGAFWRTLFPGSANTVRAITMWTLGDREPFLAAAVQRIGTLHTMPTDNWRAGGIAAPVDLESGRLGVGRIHPHKGKRQEQRFTQHPDSGAQIEGAVLPHWDRVRDTVLRAAASLAVNRYVGWDVLVDDAGRPVIIEGNGNTGVTIVQVNGGMLASPAIRRFYETCGVI